MVKCEKCGKEIDHIVTNCFNYDGSDSDGKFMIEEHDDNAVVFNIGTNWTGYELTEEEQMESIRCPFCGAFPFKHKEVQTYSFVEVVMFKE